MINVNITEGGYTVKIPILKNIEFTVGAGKLVGLIGSNGAGKSTTIQAMMGTLSYCDGQVHIDSYGYVPERPILYDYFTLWEHIDFLIRTTGQDENELKTRAKELCRQFRLTDKLYDYPTKFSKGMQQKVMLILAFTPHYNTYILDEPFMGLDPQAMRKLIQLLEDYKKSGAAILMSTHALDTAEKMCDEFVLLHNGTILKKGTFTQLKENSVVQDASLLDVFDALLEESHNVTV